MATGDIAAAAGLTLTSGSAAANTIDTELNRVLDAIVTEDNKVKARVIPIANGGTGATSAAAARNALGLGNTSGAVPVANGGTGATTASAARTNLGAAATSHTHSQYAAKNALGYPNAVAEITTSPTHAIGMFYRTDIARPVIRVDATDFPVATWPSTSDLVEVISTLKGEIAALTERVAQLEAREP